MKKTKKRVKKDILEQPERSEELFFHHMGGAGAITCNSCGYHQQLVSFIHSFPMDKWNKTGFQCQECGKFHEIENEQKLEEPIKCDCGGILSLDEQLFCPECRSTDLKYRVEYIT